MKQIYIVIEGGCLRYVSTDSKDVINNIGVTVIDLDEQEDLEDEELQESLQELSTAQKCTHIW